MNYEEKYKEAQKWVESIFPELSYERRMEAEAFFPELAESEDERIRKAIIEHLRQDIELEQILSEEVGGDWIAWLEKQGNHECDNLAIKVTHFENGREYVDLGLPSGTKWATCNVGANKPWKYGEYYAFGETKPKKNYNWDAYLDGAIISSEDCGTDRDLLKGIFDIAGTQYDAAKANWGGKWKIPTMKQMDELHDECYWVWTSNYNNSNIAGYIVYKAKTFSDKGKKIYKNKTVSSSYELSDVHIFLPAAGYRYEYCTKNTQVNGNYWASSIFANNLADTWNTNFYSTKIVMYPDGARCFGYTIRPVLK